MTNKLINQVGTSLLLISLMITACTRTRDAKLPDDAAEGTYAISDFNDISENATSSFTMKVGDKQRELDFADQSRASNENSILMVDADQLQVPERVRFMFNDLPVSAQANKSYGVAFTVDSKSLTAFKVVEKAADLSLLEQNIAVSRAEISLQKKVLSSRGKETQALFSELAKAKTARTGALYVPIFKYDIKGFGVLERVRNEIGEETSTLRLRPTEWNRATHIQLATTSSDRKLVGVDPDAQDELNRVFVADKINNKIMTYGDLHRQLDVSLNLDEKTRILTLLDTDVMKVYEVTQISKANLTDAQKQLLNNKGANSQVANCSGEIKKSLPAADQEGCILIQRFDVPLTYVRAELRAVDYTGAQSNTLQFKDLGPSEKQSGLVKIAKNVVPQEIQTSNDMDPRRTLRISDIKGKEFFFRRTLEDVSAMGTLSGGMSGTLQLVKFDLEESRLVVKKTQAAINFKKVGAMEEEEVLSLPVSYIKREYKSANGAKLAVPRFVKANLGDAEYAVIDWSANTIPVVNSPLAFYGESQCFTNVNNTQVVDTDMKLTQGILNFSYLYSVTIRPEAGCLSSFYASGDYDLGGNFGHQFVQKVRERISFKLNDHSTDKTVAPTTPFNAQNALNYGAFTMGFINPNENGVYGTEGSQINYPAVHDFTNGKTYMYTIGGMPAADTPENTHRRELLKKVAVDVFKDWNDAFHKAFAGTPLDRKGNYLELQFAGENGVVANLGDLDKNIVWFVDRPMANGLLGVSQAAINPRSGMLAADSLIIYNGNNAGQVEYFKRYYKMVKKFRDDLEVYKKSALEKMNQKTDSSAKLLKNDVTSPVTEKLLNQLKSMKTTSAKAERFTPNLQAQKSILGGLQFDKNNLKSRGKKFGQNNSTDERYYIDRIFKKALEINVAADPAALEALTAKEILATYGNRLSLQQKNLLTQKVGVTEMHSRLQKFFKNNPGCAMRVSEIMNPEVYKNYTEVSFDEAFLDSTKATLAHELGHSMGLTHNFIGSFDKANFQFEGETSKRNYSSIMDYVNDSLQNYAGLGPYDVYAIRATYTGLIELRPEARTTKALTDAKFTGSLVGGRFINVDDIQKSYATTGWANFTGAGVRKLIMPFKYCTDKDLGYEPTCRQFDFGTTPLDIVKNDIQSYEDSYIFSRYGYDRLSFGWENASGVISRTVSTMLNVRQFLDEAVYRLVVGKDASFETPYFEAAAEVHRFLLNIITTPDTDKKFMDFSRFTPVAYETIDKDGKKGKSVAFLEARQQKNSDATPDRFEAIGNETDKLLAMQVLTLKGVGMSKYEELGLGVSFVDFEKFTDLMQENGVSPITTTLAKVLTKNLNGRMILTDGVVTSTDLIEPTQSMTAYAGISAILGLETDVTDQKDNFANLFKVGASVGARPTDRVALSELSAPAKSSAALSYWALDNATVSGAMLDYANEKFKFISLAEPLKAPMGKLHKSLIQFVIAKQSKNELTAKTAQDAANAAGGEILKVLQEANKDGSLISKEALAANPVLSLENHTKLIVQMSQGIVTLTMSRIAAGDDKAKIGEVQKAAQEYVNQLQNIADKLPLIAAAQLASTNGMKDVVAQKQKQVKAGEKDDELTAFGTHASIVSQLFSAGGKLESDYGSVINNVKFLNALTRMTNPEFSR